ncbi:MFS transporter [Sphingobium sp. HWE2-09]|uniref:MFS transporter n=1 Tax=Sphingobium sp. HWE2-09 TaxID=3108390 RepID=UPI002DD40015|nr:MFS transporter [Sphingobium sp. HWE2-09]
MTVVAGSIAPATPQASSRFPFVPLLALAAMMAISAALMGSFSPVQEAVKADMKLTDFQLSLVQGLATALPIALFQIPIGRLADRSNRVRLLSIMALSWTVGTFLTAFASGLAMLFVARMLVGFGVMCSIPVGISLVADFCSPKTRGRGLLLPVTGRWLGAAGGFVLTGWLFGLLKHSDQIEFLADMAPWRSTHLFLVLFGVALLLPLLVLREPARQEQTLTNASLAQVWIELRDRRTFLLPLFIGYTAAIMADIGASIWAAPLLARKFGLGPDQFGGWMGAVVFGSGMIGTVSGGFFADLGQHSARRGGILFAAVAAVAISVPASLFSLAPSAPIFGVMLAILLLCGAVIALVTTAALSIMVPNEIRGIAISITLTVAGLVGYGVAPTLVTWISSIMGGEQHLGAALAITTTTISVISFFAFLKAIANAPSAASA